jgi:hypothetical protein
MIEPVMSFLLRLVDSRVASAGSDRHRVGNPSRLDGAAIRAEPEMGSRPDGRSDGSLSD